MTEREIAVEILRRLGVNVSNKDNFRIRCLNHKPDNHPSMDVSLSEKGGYCHCWSCGYSNDLRHLYKETTGHYINDDLKIPNNKSNQSLSRKVVSKPAVDFDKTPESNFVFEGNTIPLQDSDVGKKWIETRGLTDKVIHENNIKYVVSGKTVSKQYPNNEDLWTYFTDRAIIPIYEGDVLLSLEGRDLRGEEYFNQGYGKTHPEVKYRKVIYPKGATTMTLFQLDKLDKSKRLFFTEGIIDVLSLKTNDFFVNENVSCVFKNRLSERQVHLLKQFSELIYIPDNDIPSLTGLLEMHKQLPHLKYLLPPEGVKDINDILQGKHKEYKSVDTLVGWHWDTKYLSDDFNIIQYIVNTGKVEEYSKDFPVLTKKESDEYIELDLYRQFNSKSELYTSDKIDRLTELDLKMKNYQKFIEKENNMNVRNVRNVKAAPEETAKTNNRKETVNISTKISSNDTTKINSDKNEPVKDYIKRNGIVRIGKDNGVVMILTKNHIYNSTSFKNAFKRATEVLNLNEDDPDYPTYNEDFRPDLKPGCNPREMIYNTYKGFGVEPRKPNIVSCKENDYQGDTKAFYDHIKVWCEKENKEIYELVLAIIAQLFQNPEFKVGKAIVLRGKQGSGKGIIYHEFLEPILGAAASLTKKANFLTGDFDGEIKDKLLYWIDEVSIINNSQFETLKSLVTEKSLDLHRKFLEPKKCKNYTRFIIATNNNRSIKLDKDNRRFLCLELSDKHVGNQEYFETLAKELKEHRAEILWELLHRDISKTNWTTVPMTNEALNQIELSKDETTEFIEEFLESVDDGSRQLKNYTISVNDFFNEYNESKSVKFKLSQKKLSQRLTKDFSDRFKKDKQRIDGKLENIWIIKPKI
jgi:hypothetical protein